MKAIAKRTTLALALFAALSGTAQAVIDGPRFYKETDKFSANTATGRVRTLCICQDGGPNHYHAGYLVKSVIGVAGGIHVTMTCQIPTITSVDQTYVNASNCLTYEVLSR